MISNKSNDNEVAINLTNKHPELTFSWSHLSVHTRDDNKFSCTAHLRGLKFGGKSQQERRVLLDDVSGIVQPGQILAIMGASGVGKTTLLKMLSGLDDPSTLELVSGTIMVNGRVTTRNERIKSSCIGHVEQNQVFIETMTLHEHLIFQAMLRMHSLSMTDDDRRSGVLETIKLLSLEKCTSTIISKLSGGERKRLAFATVALTDPSIMLIDEPTSNLDAYLAKSLMDTIRKLAVEGRRSMIIVLHQPTSEMFKFIDLLCVLVQNGKQAFFGSTNSEASLFFANDCGLIGSSLDIYIEQLAAPETAASKEALEAVEQFSKSSYALSLASLTVPSNNISSLITTYGSTPNIFRQMKWLLWRSYMSGIRNRVHTYDALVKTFIPAIVLGLLYFDLAHRNPSRLYKTNVNALLIVIIYVSATTCGTLISGTVPNAIFVFLKETQQHMYGTLAFYISTYLHDFPKIILVSATFSSIIYWCASIPIDHNNFLHFLAFVTTVVLTSITSASMGAFIASFSGSVESAVATTVPVLQILVVFSDYFLDLNRLPFILYILPYLSPFYYGYSILNKLQWNNGTSSSTDVIYFDVAMLFLLFIIFNLLAFIVIWFRAHQYHIAEKWKTITKQKTIN
ncbi:unnamed protein product [Adineta steineri]|uniref:ABC transporter domain-containing protein n=1 Tax=Adineta steineri TaxID=433720 RepID=A0A819NJL9_9BILA|nr:unnamed protein product [Adineta steineri]CAF3998002.1 unnamed protein product [Adineta steineri]